MGRCRYEGPRCEGVRSQGPQKKGPQSSESPILEFSGFDALEVLLQQRIVTHGKWRVFPHHSKSVGTVFRRGCKALKIDDLHFHDLGHAVSRLFEAGLTIARRACYRAQRLANAEALHKSKIRDPMAEVDSDRRSWQSEVATQPLWRRSCKP
jgi:hypothetical protein